MFKQSLCCSVIFLALVASGCASIQPQSADVNPGIPSEWPLPPLTMTAPVATKSAAGIAAVEIGWRDFFVDQRLEDLIDLALENNRDLRVAVINIDRARALYRIQRADRLPWLGVNGEVSRARNSAGLSEQYNVGIGIANFELDLFGRVRSLSEAALQSFLATEEARRSAQLSLIAEVANTWLTLAADQELQRIAQATLESHEASYKLTEQRHDLGAVSALDVSQARTIVEGARSDAARFAGQVAQDRNALALLVGTQFNPALLPDAFEPKVSGLAPLPAGVPSEVLLRRPDVLAAEHRLFAAKANVAAARAAFFPRIRLTGSLGSASGELDGLFDSGSRAWSFLPSISIPIFQGGRLRGNLGVAKADQEIAIAEYERAIQAGFREIADALALSDTILQQRLAQEALLEAALRTHELSEARYKAGLDSFLVLLDAQRTLFNARLSLVATQQLEQSNRVLLYKALGGGWQERSP